MTDPIPEPLTAVRVLRDFIDDWAVTGDRAEMNAALDALRAALARQATPENYWTHDCCAGAVVTVHAPDCARQATPASGGLDVDVLAQELDKHFEGDHRLNADHAVCARNIAKRYAARLTSEATIREDPR